MTAERHVAAPLPQVELGAAGGGMERARGAPSNAPADDALVTWIPGEVIAAYSAVVLLMQPAADEGAPSSPMEITRSRMADIKSDERTSERRTE